MKHCFFCGLDKNESEFDEVFGIAIACKTCKSSLERSAQANADRLLKEVKEKRREAQ